MSPLWQRNTAVLLAEHLKQWLPYVPPTVTLKSLALTTLCTYVCSMVSKIDTGYLTSINRLLFITATDFVLCEVRTRFLYIIRISVSLHDVNVWYELFHLRLLDAHWTFNTLNMPLADGVITYLLHGAESFLRSQLVLQLIKKFPAFYGTRKFITVLTSARHPSLSLANSIQSPQPLPTSWRSILILSSRLRLGLPNGLFPSGFSTMVSLQKESTAVSLCEREVICRDSGGYNTGDWHKHPTAVFAVIWLFHCDRDFYVVSMEMTLHSPLHLHGVAHD